MQALQKIEERINKTGPVAQLNRVSDSGSEGSGFEPQRGHKKRTVSITARFLIDDLQIYDLRVIYDLVEFTIVRSMINRQ